LLFSESVEEDVLEELSEFLIKEIIIFNY